VAQLFIQGGQRRIVGALGALQFEIIQHRLVHEYGAACRMETLPYARACWITSRDPGVPGRSGRLQRGAEAGAPPFRPRPGSSSAAARRRR
jgi:peptide subunit release factor RF-3